MKKIITILAVLVLMMVAAGCFAKETYVNKPIQYILQEKHMTVDKVSPAGKVSYTGHNEVNIPLDSNFPYMEYDKGRIIVYTTIVTKDGQQFLRPMYTVLVSMDESWVLQPKDR